MDDYTVKFTGSLEDVVTLYCSPIFGNIFMRDGCKKALDIDTLKDIIASNSHDHECSLHQPDEPDLPHVHFKIPKEKVNLFVKRLFDRHLRVDNTEKYYNQFSAAKKFLHDNDTTRAIFFPDGNFVHNYSCVAMNISETVTDKDHPYSIGLDVC